MRDWLRALHDALQSGAPAVRVVVASVRGSAPREPGACMLVLPTGEHGTIGGGHLEFVATRVAREMLEASAAHSRLDRFSLGASLGQCCGGIVELWFQRYHASDLPFLAQALKDRESGEAVVLMPYERLAQRHTRVWLYGAGHVARALVHVLAPLPFAITWVDSRESIFLAALPANVRTIHSPEPAEEVRDMSRGDWALVMTHSHDEDFAICEALLRHAAFGWAGVIGSVPKATRFRQRLLQRGFSSAEISRLVMPIGIGGIRSKEAAAIAVAVAAQLLQLRDKAADEGLVTMAARAS